MRFLVASIHSLLAVTTGKSVTVATAVPRIESGAQPCHSVDEIWDLTTAPDVRNANLIFNAIHSSMRQWGSSWHHNGMSFFLATVPEATQFYHGTDTPEPINGTQWLAFEPEHALVFAERGPPPPGGGPRGPGGPPPLLSSIPPPHRDRNGQKPSKDKNKKDHHHRGSNSKDQEPLGLKERSPNGHKLPPHISSQDQPFPSDKQPSSGWLHTYITKHALSLLYIDGMSGAKTSKGTLDSQDYLLLNWTSDSRRDNPMFGEHDRAEGLCKMAERQWEGKIDGFLRMEAGFEIILCDFKKHLDLVRATQVKRRNGLGRGNPKDETDNPDGPPRGVPPGNIWSWFPAIAARYHGIGGGRVTLNYNNFVTAFSYQLDLFHSSSPTPTPNESNSSTLPRLQNISTQSLDPIRHDIDNLILTHASTTPNPKAINWQSKADMIVTRYSNKLRYWQTLTNETQITLEAANLMKPFIDMIDRDAHAEIERCTYQFLPYPSQTSAAHFDTLSMAYHALVSVSNRICTTLSQISYPVDPTATTTTTTTTTTDIQTITSNLITYLSWSSFAECPDSCSLDEICFLPIWPLGSKLEHERGYGRCVNESGIGGIGGGPGQGGDGGGGGGGYWNDL